MFSDNISINLFLPHINRTLRRGGEIFAPSYSIKEAFVVEGNLPR